MRHDRRSAPIERERTRHHAAVAYRHQLWHTTGTVGNQQVDRIGAAICGLPARQRSPWADGPQPAPLDETFGMRQAVRLLGQMRDLVRRRKNSKGVSPLSGCLLARLPTRDWLASGDRRFACYGASREWQVAARACGARR